MKLFRTILLLLTALPLVGQKPQFNTWSLAEGLPQSQVWSAMQDGRGYIWFGTQGGGLSRFDGKQFKNYTYTDGLPSNYIHSIFQEKDYRLFIGTADGVAQFDGRKITALPQKGMQVNLFGQISDKEIWAGTNKGLYFLHQDTFAVEKLLLNPELDRSDIHSILSLKQLWVGASSGLWKIEKGVKHTKNATKTTKIAGFQDIYAMLPSENERIWLAVWGRGLVLFDTRTERVVSEINDPLLLRPLCMRMDKSNQICIGTQNNGLLFVNPNDFSIIQVSEKEGLPHNNVRSTFEDRSGHLWVATSGGGVARRGNIPFRLLNQANGLSGNRIYAVEQDDKGRIWAAVSQNGVEMLDSVRFRKPFQDSLLSGVKCKTLCNDHQGHIWIGTEGKGIFVADSNKLLRLTQKEGLPSDWIQKILVDKAGKIWAATYADGLVKIEIQQNGLFSIKKYGKESGLPSLNIYSMISDEKGRILIGGQNGNITCMENGKTLFVLSQAHKLPQAAIQTMNIDAWGRLWVGTKGDGVWRSDFANQNAVFKRVEGIASQNIYLMLSDKAKNLWIGFENGVNKIIFDSRGNPVKIRFYGKNEGFTGIETCHDAALCDQNGDLWFGTMNGLMQYSSNREGADFEQPPAVYFSGISLDYRPLETTEFARFLADDGGLLSGLVLPFNKNSISFQFEGVNPDRPEGIVYSWLLSPINRDWSQSKTNSINYANLAPGDYTFVVRAGNSKPITAAFTVSEPFWKNIWFRLAALAFFLGLVWAYVRRVKKQEQKRREALEIQNRLLQLEQKALQLQMNPHFIFNALNSIQSLIVTQDYTVARQEINHFAKLMRNILNNSRKSTITLQEEMETLEQYLRMEQFCQKNPFTFTISAKEGIDVENIEIPPMLLQPFVENAVIHGVSHLPYPGQIEVFFEAIGDKLHCTVSDNGIGREKAALLREARRPGHQSAALSVTQERLAAIGGALELRDRINGTGEVCGTIVEIWIGTKD